MTTDYITVNRPVAFPGTPEERLENQRTHDWNWADDEVRCWRCDSKAWHVAADYPCGVEPPRETVRIPR